MPPVKYFTVTLLQKSMDECVIKKKKNPGSSLVAQWIEDPVLSLQQAWVVAVAWFTPWPRNFHMPRAQPKNK